MPTRERSAECLSDVFIQSSRPYEEFRTVYIRKGLSCYHLGRLREKRKWPGVPRKTFRYIQPATERFQSVIPSEARNLCAHEIKHLESFLVAGACPERSRGGSSE